MPGYILSIFQSYEAAFRYSLVSAQSLQLLHGHPEVERVKVPFLKLAVSLATSLGHDPRPYNKQLSELRYTGAEYRSRLICSGGDGCREEVFSSSSRAQ